MWVGNIYIYINVYLQIAHDSHVVFSSPGSCAESIRRLQR